MTSRVCTACNETTTTRVRRGMCNVCYGKEYFQRNKERIYHWRQRNKARLDDSVIRHYFGISMVQYDALLAEQKGLCAVCRRPETKKSRFGDVVRLAVDHDHACCSGNRSCGQCIRGLLCHACNVSSGQLGDDPARMRALADYVETRSIKNVKEPAA